MRMMHTTAGCTFIDMSGGAFSTAEIASFARDGFVRVSDAVPLDVVAEVRAAAAARVPLGCTDSWFLGYASVYDLPVLVQALTPAVRDAFESLTGKGRWHLAANWGFPTRLPGPGGPAVGWHIDGDWFTHHLPSGEQVLSPIFLWDDVGPDDGPTLLAVGSHHAVARLLNDAEPEGVPGEEIGRFVNRQLPVGETVAATGSAGDVIICHPFLAHSVNPVGPMRPRYISNVAVHGFAALNLDASTAELLPVERAIVEALEG
jgi:hypothetical protein